MPVDTETKRKRFRALHESGCFLIPNPWDIGSARRLEQMGFKALASTSSGSAWALGREDGQLSCDEVLNHLRQLCAATDLPVNADFEGGFAEDLEQLARNVAAAVATGVAGLSIEDYNNGHLYDPAEATQRIAAARAAIDSTGEDVLLIARAEGFLRGRPDLNDVISRMVSYAQTGADCLYAPGPKDLTVVKEIVDAVAPKPVNVLLYGPELRVADLAAIGVRRISVGGSLAAHAWAAFDRVARMLRDEGTLPPRPQPPS